MASDGASSRVGDAEDSLEKINWLWVLVGICFRVQCSETVVAWTCSWDLNSLHYMYAELQNGSILMFDMARELKMPALLSETSMSNKPLKRNMFTHLAAMLLLSQPLCPGQLQNSLFYHIWMSSTLSPSDKGMIILTA